ncbi:OmpH family outer membrane protein [Alphaproteobacteria bacterium]|nr:OmpH family outer membrane protein [Alphaproteobacteria bacterium]
MDFQIIIEANKNLSLLYDQINKDQEAHKKKFNSEELSLQSELERIEKLNLILEPSELEKEIDKYNAKLNNFNKIIEEFNLHYEKQINNLKNRIINIILDILKVYSEENKIDLILDSNNYILSSNSINITELIKDQVNTKTIEINFEKY